MYMCEVAIDQMMTFIEVIGVEGTVPLSPEGNQDIFTRKGEATSASLRLKRIPDHAVVMGAFGQGKCHNDGDKCQHTPVFDG